ncbi:Histone acetyltransferase HPA2 and related acetyltransferases [hydrothermal vent metagenome]|uniref:Histone acetyltransferase HPA2 and related acetyltransferases n=1 Tax=hydrothermal vent metagenome TaxID=652676 RepID=A0A3B0U9G8_9ZZZZ
MSVTLRKGTKEDLPQILELIKELALFEKAPEQVENTVEKMKKDGFGSNPVYWFFVAEHQGKIIGTAIYYLRYSTWKGIRLYLEDLIITEKARGKGAGKMLFEACIREAKAKGYSGMAWQVLDWNTPAIDFYKTYDAHLDGEWINGSLDF